LCQQVGTGARLVARHKAGWIFAANGGLALTLPPLSPTGDLPEGGQGLLEGTPGCGLSAVPRPAPGRAVEVGVVGWPAARSRSGNGSATYGFQPVRADQAGLTEVNMPRVSRRRSPGPGRGQLGPPAVGPLHGVNCAARRRQSGGYPKRRQPLISHAWHCRFLGLLLGRLGMAGARECSSERRPDPEAPHALGDRPEQAALKAVALWKSVKPLKAVGLREPDAELARELADRPSLHRHCGPPWHISLYRAAPHAPIPARGIPPMSDRARCRSVLMPTASAALCQRRRARTCAGDGGA
jgi:hypothetical protein